MRMGQSIPDNREGTRGGAMRARSTGIFFALVCAALAPVLISQAMPGSPTDNTQTPPSPSAYAGDAACAQCHRKEAEFYARTAHARDSAPAAAEHVLGSFLPGHNVMRTSDPDLVVNMVAGRDGFYQNAVNLAHPENHLTERMDIVIGSGRHGQTYLYWQGDQLYELPVSYWTWDHDWVISPGMPDGQIHFDRAIVPRCLECHASYFRWIPPDASDTAANRFAKDSLVLGIGCERCHGPGAEHVARERAAPGRNAGTRTSEQAAAGSNGGAIVNPAKLSRDQQISLCSLCHAGAVEPLRPPMTFLVGDNIRDFLAIQPSKADEPVDVHGNQVGKLEESKCFAGSQMTCSTCHDVHRTQEDADAFNRHCLACHAISACGRYHALGAAIRTRCVDCHMPEQESGKIVSNTGGRTLHGLFRTHRIAIYPEASAHVERAIAGK